MPRISGMDKIPAPQPDGIFNSRGMIKSYPDRSSSVTFVIIPKTPGPVYIDLQLPPVERLRAAADGPSSTRAHVTPKRSRDDTESSDTSSRKKNTKAEPPTTPRVFLKAVENAARSDRALEGEKLRTSRTPRPVVNPAENPEESVTEPETEPEIEYPDWLVEAVLASVHKKMLGKPRGA
ncbi:hypothetical protein B0H21DRAFT_748850 [Amylocystis lapponica]|nr:hypothetical protein B0H21DRAFT_748850 [Amylocystis lapponica]